MESTDKIKMLLALETYLQTNSTVIIRTTNEKSVQGTLLSYDKAIPAEMYFDPVTGDIIDPPEILHKLTIGTTTGPVTLNFRQIANFSPI